MVAVGRPWGVQGVGDLVHEPDGGGLTLLGPMVEKIGQLVLQSGDEPPGEPVPFVGEADQADASVEVAGSSLEQPSSRCAVHQAADVGAVAAERPRQVTHGRRSHGRAE